MLLDGLDVVGSSTATFKPSKPNFSLIYSHKIYVLSYNWCTLPQYDPRGLKHVWVN